MPSLPFGPDIMAALREDAEQGKRPLTAVAEGIIRSHYDARRREAQREDFQRAKLQLLQRLGTDETALQKLLSQAQ